jgi:hypothetical protein
MTSFAFSVILLRAYIYGVKRGEWAMNILVLYVGHEIFSQLIYVVDDDEWVERYI